MADIITSSALWVVQLLITLLPDSFVSGWLSGISTNLTWVQAGLGALNWLFDINGMLVVLGLWLVAAEAYMLAVLGVSTFHRVMDMLASVLYSKNWLLDLLGL